MVGGVTALLLMIGLAVGLPQLVGNGDESGSGESGSGGNDTATPADEPIELPSDVGTWTDLQPLIESQDPEGAAQYAAEWEYADATFEERTDVASATARYFDTGTQSQVAIQAYRGPDGPLVPATIADPASGTARIVLSEFGEIECVLDVIAGTDSPTPQVQEMQCRRTSDALTVRAFVVSGASGEGVETLIDGIWEAIE